MSALDPTAPVGVLGAGTMGAGIAQVAAAAGHPVLLFDVADGAAEAGRDGIAKALERVVAKGKMAAADRDGLLDRITPCQTFEDLKPALLVVEAVLEDLDVKQKVFTDLEKLLAPEAILATNTSSIAIAAIAAALDDPSRLVGMHFFNPAPLMALVEVVSGIGTASGVADIVFDTAANWGKSPVHAKSTPGFIVNRVARPFYAEALRLLEEGAADAATIDAVLTGGGGFRMGPFALMDLIGHDVNYAVTCSVFEAFYQDPRFLPSLVQKELVDGGLLGRKSGHGFFGYGKGADNPQAATALAGPKPRKVYVEGDLGPLAPLLARIEAAGIATSRTHADGPGGLALGGLLLMLTDGRTATQRAHDESLDNLVVFDLVLDYAKASHIALAAADQADAKAAAKAAGLFQALGFEVSVIDDAPGLIVMRTVAMLANIAASAVHTGVADAASVDIAMMKGVNYPQGPLAWADAAGPGVILTVLDNLAACYGDGRYRASPWLRRRAAAGKPLLDD